MAANYRMEAEFQGKSNESNIENENKPPRNDPLPKGRPKPSSLGSFLLRALQGRRALGHNPSHASERKAHGEGTELAPHPPQVASPQWCSASYDQTSENSW